MKVTVKLLVVLFTLFSSASNALAPEDFIKKAYYRDIKISPDGKHIAVSMVTSKESTIIFFDRETFKPVGRLGFSENTEPGDFYWANNDRVVFKLLEIEPWSVEPNYYGQLLGVNIDGTGAETLFGYQNSEDSLSGGGRAKKRKKATSGWAEVIDLLPDDPKNIIIQSTPYKKDYSSHPSILKLNVYSGKITTRLGVSPVERGEFLSDGKGNIRLVYGFDEKNRIKVYQRKDNKSSWKLIDNKYYTSSFNPVEFIQDSDEIYLGDSGKKDKWTLYKMNINTGVYSAPLVDKNIDLTTINRVRTLAAVRFDDGYPEYEVIHPKSEDGKLFTKLINTFKNRKVSVTSQSEDGNFSIVYASSDIEAAVFYLYQKNTNQLKRLFASMPHIKSTQLAAMLPIKFASKDGKVISGYLTLPKNTSKEHPAIVLVHGGPHGVRDYWGYDQDVQLLASQGYAVFQINYRGSKGYGEEFEADGFKHWGDLIQQDIISGSQWLGQQPDIDENRMCIMGASFGAYSAVMSATLSPELFKCVVANAGVYDLALMFEKGDVYSTFDGEDYLNQVLGEDSQQLSTFSPVNRVEFIEAPVLIAHGEKDRRAPLEHALKLKAAMEKHNKPFEWFVKDKEAHGFYSEESQLAYWNKVILFLNKWTRKNSQKLD